MKKFILYTSALVLAGGVSYAMDEEAMDGEMMEAPSVAVMVGGSAKMGIKNVSTDGNPASDGLQLIREYEITFDSSGTTDGGLMFGAGISFDQDASGTSTSDAGTASTNTIPEGEQTRNVDVNGYALTQDVWVLGGALTTAVTTIDPDNLAEDHELNTSEDDEPLPITQALVDAYNANDANANDLQKIMITWDSIANNASAMETEDLDLNGDGSLDTDPVVITVSGVTRERATVMVTDTDTDTDTNTHKVRNGIDSASVYVGAADGSWKLKFGTGLDAGIYKIGDIGVAGEGDSFYATNSHSVELSGSFEGAEYVITSNAGADGDPDNQWSAGVKYNAGQVSVGVGMDSEKGLGLSVGSDVSGVSVNMIYTKAEMGEGDMMKENSALGVSAGIAAGDGATVTLKYSTNKTEGMGANERKLLEADFAYDLGGGAKFNAGVDSLDHSTNGKKTTLEASIAMSF